MIRKLATPLRMMLAATLLLLAACGGPEASLPALSPTATILAFGDSLTWGTGVKRDQSYPAQLERLIDRKVVNAGIPGEKTAEGRKRLAGVLDETRPSLVILCLGGNDFLRKVPRDRTRSNLDAMLSEIRGRGIPVILIGVPEPTLFMLDADPLYAELAEKFRIPLEDEILPEILADKSLKADPIHPNAAGYAQFARALANLMRETGALP